MVLLIESLTELLIEILTELLTELQTELLTELLTEIQTEFSIGLSTEIQIELLIEFLTELITFEFINIFFLNINPSLFKIKPIPPITYAKCIIVSILFSIIILSIISGFVKSRL